MSLEEGHNTWNSLCDDNKDQNRMSWLRYSNATAYPQDQIGSDSYSANHIDFLNNDFGSDLDVKVNKKDNAFWDGHQNPEIRLRTSLLVENINNAKKTTTANVSVESEDNTPTYSFTGFEEWANKKKKTYNPLASDIVIVEEILEREGIIFKHTNYSVKHTVELPNTYPSNDRTVIRRYSDFVWLRDVLLKKFPFRIIPELPPKQVGLQNATKSFQSYRRQGLERFINLVMKHPILKFDDLVLTFLTVPTELSNWRRQVIYDTSDEFTDVKISPEFKKIWDDKLLQPWESLYSSIGKSIIVWNNMRLLTEKYDRKLLYIAQEKMVFKECINIFSQQTDQLYPLEHSKSLVEVKSHLKSVEIHMNDTFKLILNETKETSNSLLPKFVTYIEILKSLKKLYERYRFLSKTTIPQLERRVELQEEKLLSMQGHPDTSGVEYDKILQMIEKDKKEISTQINRSWLIKQCILEEFILFQQTQYLISDALQDWTRIYSTFMGLQLNEWEKLAVSLTEMPSIQ